MADILIREYREILVCVSTIRLHQRSGKVSTIMPEASKKIIFNYSNGSWNGDVGRLGVGDHSNIIKNTGKNKFYLYVDTPFYTNTFGSYVVKIPVRLKNKRMEFINAKTYKVCTSFYYTLKTYKLARKMPLYKTASNKKKITVLKPGTKFAVSKIKPVHLTPSDIGINADLYVKVKTCTGKTGWLYFPNLSNEDKAYTYLTYRPAWG